MLVMVSARDLITIFVALETISIPTFILAGLAQARSGPNEAGVKYYLIGVLSSALMLYGMSLIFGLPGSTLLAEISEFVAGDRTKPLLTVAIFLTLVGFAFKVSAVPFHFWAPDTYEGAPTPVTAFLSVASKAGGFVALLNILFFGFYGTRCGRPTLLVADPVDPGGVDDARQPRRAAPDEHRAHARLLVDRARRVHPRALRRGGHRRHGNARSRSAFEAVVIYLLIYGAMNLGAFAVVIAVARRTRSGRDRLVRRPVPDVAGAGRADDDVPGRRWPGSRRWRGGSPSS